MNKKHPIKFDLFKNLVTEEIFYALHSEPMIRIIDGEDYIEVTQDFKRVHLVLKSSLVKQDTVSVKL